MKLFLLTDYKGRFGSKHFDKPYRSGMDKKKLSSFFAYHDIEVDFVGFSDLCNNTNTIDLEAYYLYTSSEDINYHYKSYIEDVILYLCNCGCKVIPSYEYLRANNNKVFMSLMLRSKTDNNAYIPSFVYGTKEEMMKDIENFNFPMIVKSAEGSSGRNVFKAENHKDILKIVSKVSASKRIKTDIRDNIRALRHSGYLKESNYRRKYIIQKMITNLNNDWKIYYFMDKIYVFYRPILKGRIFRASGGGYDNYSYGDCAYVPDGLFDFVQNIVSSFEVPHASLDIGYDGKRFHLFEIQFLYFGTAGIPYSTGYFHKEGRSYVYIKEKLTIEQVYADAISNYIRNLNSEGNFCV